MNATSSTPGGGTTETPLFYSPRVVSIEETTALLAQQRDVIPQSAPLFYWSHIVSIEETTALLAQQRAREAQTPRSGVSEVSFSCSNRCSVCLHHIACHGILDLKRFSFFFPLNRHFGGDFL